MVQKSTDAHAVKDADHDEARDLQLVERLGQFFLSRLIDIGVRLLGNVYHDLRRGNQRVLTVSVGLDNLRLDVSLLALRIDLLDWLDDRLGSGLNLKADRVILGLPDVHAHIGRNDELAPLEHEEVADGDVFLHLEQLMHLVWLIAAQI